MPLTVFTDKLFLSPKNKINNLLLILQPVCTLPQNSDGRGTRQWHDNSISWVDKAIIFT